MNWESKGSEQRAKVFGGWLVKSFEEVITPQEDQPFASGWEWRASMAFVPDAKHEWDWNQNEQR